MLYVNYMLQTSHEVVKGSYERVNIFHVHKCTHYMWTVGLDISTIFSSMCEFLSKQLLSRVEVSHLPWSCFILYVPQIINSIQLSIYILLTITMTLIVQAYVRRFFCYEYFDFVLNRSNIHQEMTSKNLIHFLHPFFSQRQWHALFTTTFTSKIKSHY